MIPDSYEKNPLLVTSDPLQQNIAGHLTRRAALDPLREAVVCPTGRLADGRPVYSHLTFDQLDRESNLVAAALCGYGIAPGQRVVLMVKPSLAFFTLTFALFKAGCVPVLIDPGMGLSQLKRCLCKADPHAFIGIPAAHLARILLHWPPYGKEKRLVTTRLPWGGAITLDRLKDRGVALYASAPGRPAKEYGPPKTKETQENNETDTPAAILFTSGSTGPAKGVLYHHRHFQAQVSLIRGIWHIAPGEFDLCTFPLFALFAPALGMTAVIPEMDFTRPARVDPRRILEAFDHYPINNMFGSPALLTRLAFAPETLSAGRSRFASLNRVVSAGAPAVLSTLAAMAHLLPQGVQIHTPYGATEALPVTSIGSDEILGETAAASRQGAGICIGRPVPGTSVEIIPISDEPLPRWSAALSAPKGAIGEIVVRGPQVTSTYFRRPECNLLAKISVDGSAAPFHRMGDLGYFDDKGRLWFCGRKNHRVSLQGGDLFTIPTEALFNTHAAVRRTALVGVPSPKGNLMTPMLCVETKKRWLGKKERSLLRKELMAMASALEATRPIRTILFHRSFPVDIRHNAKIFREKLARWAALPRLLRWLAG